MEDKKCLHGCFRDKWAIFKGKLNGRFQQTCCKISFEFPKKVYKSRDKANSAIVLHSVLQGAIDTYWGITHHFTTALTTGFPEKSALNEAKMINACCSHLWFIKEITLLLFLESLVGFPHNRLKRERQELGFSFFAWGKRSRVAVVPPALSSSTEMP